MADDQSFAQELSSLINSRSLENVSDTPDYILAEFMRDSMTLLNKAILARDRHKARPVGNFAKEAAHLLGLDENTMEDLFSKGWYINYETMTMHSTGRTNISDMEPIKNA